MDKEELKTMPNERTMVIALKRGELVDLMMAATVIKWEAKTPAIREKYAAIHDKIEKAIIDYDQRYTEYYGE